MFVVRSLGYACKLKSYSAATTVKQLHKREGEITKLCPASKSEHIQNKTKVKHGRHPDSEPGAKGLPYLNQLLQTTIQA